MGGTSGTIEIVDLLVEEAHEEVIVWHRYCTVGNWCSSARGKSEYQIVCKSQVRRCSWAWRCSDGIA